ncbi:MAG: hypothetical protein HY778_06820 [Betaproteobacteria bacterium]|nr:hypothetical protein [Betaproteobacteria bacterium]
MKLNDTFGMNAPVPEHSASAHVYERTRAGDDALSQPLRLLQRNLRLLLALVDGRKTVDGLSQQFGDATLVADALRQLEALGLIALRSDGKGWAPTATVYQFGSAGSRSAKPEELSGEWASIIGSQSGFSPVYPAPTPRHEAPRLAWEASGLEFPRHRNHLWVVVALLGSLAFTAAVAFG